MYKPWTFFVNWEEASTNWVWNRTNLNSGNLNCSKAHWARLTRSIYLTVRELFSVQLLTGLSFTYAICKRQQMLYLDQRRKENAAIVYPPVRVQTNYHSDSSHFSVSSWVFVFPNHVVTADDYFTITNDNCTKWIPIFCIDTLVCFFNWLFQEYVIGILVNCRSATGKEDFNQNFSGQHI